LAGDQLPYRFTPPAGWVSFTAPSVDAAWVLKSQKDTESKTTTLLVHTKKNSRPYEFKGPGRERLIDIVQKTRGALLRLTGLKDWTIDESKLEEIQGGKALHVRLRGHYIGVKGQPVEFFERAYFIEDRYYQFSFHQPAQGAPVPSGGSKRLSPADADHLLEGFVPEGL